MSAYFVEGSDPSGYTLYINIIGVRRTDDALEKKNFSEYLVDSKSCCTFAFATPKKGRSEVFDARLEVGGDDS